MGEYMGRIKRFKSTNSKYTYNVTEQKLFRHFLPVAAVLEYEGDRHEEDKLRQKR